LTAQISPTPILISETAEPRDTSSAPVVISHDKPCARSTLPPSWSLTSATLVFAAIITFTGLELSATSRRAVGMPEVLATARIIQVVDGFVRPSTDAVKQVPSQARNISQTVSERRKQYASPSGYGGSTSPFTATSTRTDEVAQSSSLPDINFDANQIPAALLLTPNPTPPAFAPARISESSKQIDGAQHETLSQSAQQRTAFRVSKLRDPVQIGAVQKNASRQGLNETTQSFLSKRSGSTHSLAYIAPRPLKEVMPDTRAYGLSLSRAPIEIEVQVKIRQNGTVMDAFVPRSRNSGSRSPFEFPAIAAAKQWIFEPAKMHGKDIPSDYSIRFSFRPNAQ
jgi:hypothetical protein